MAKADPATTSLAMIGNLIAFLASVFTEVYLVVVKDLRAKIDLFVHLVTTKIKATLRSVALIKVSLC